MAIQAYDRHGNFIVASFKMVAKNQDVSLLVAIIAINNVVMAQVGAAGEQGEQVLQFTQDRL